MKLNLEVELDFINDEMSVNETIKQNIIDAVVGKIQGNVEKKVEGKINDIIDKTIINKINKMTEKLFNDFMNKKISLTDGYGSVIKCYETVTDVIKERFDNFMTETVDEKGNTYSGSYGQKHKRLTWANG